MLLMPGVVSVTHKPPSQLLPKCVGAYISAVKVLQEPTFLSLSMCATASGELLDTYLSPKPTTILKPGEDRRCPTHLAGGA